MFTSTVVAFFLVLAVAHAFVSNHASTKISTSLNAKSKAVPFLEASPVLEGMVGDKGFDPVGFSNFIDIKWLREAELKHGRVCMLAVVGFVATEWLVLPGAVHSVNPVAAHDAAVKSGAMLQILGAITALEAISIIAIRDMMDGGDRVPGDYGFDPLRLSMGVSEAKKRDFALKEVENGRLAMVAFSGMITQAVMTGHGFPYTF